MVTCTGFKPVNARVKGVCVESLHQQAKLAATVGIEPTTNRLTAGCSTAELCSHSYSTNDYNIIEYYFIHIVINNKIQIKNRELKNYSWTYFNKMHNLLLAINFRICWFDKFFWFSRLIIWYFSIQISYSFFFFALCNIQFL